MKEKNVYEFSGVLRLARLDVDIDNAIIEAYTDKQAILKLAFYVRERLGDNYNTKDLYKAILRSKLHMRRR